MPRHNLFSITASAIHEMFLSVVSRRRDITGSGGPLEVDVLSRGESIVLLSWSDSEGVGTEEVSLSLDEVGGEGLGTVAIEEGERGGVRRDGDTLEGRLSNDTPPSWLSLGNGLQEEGADEQVLELWVLTVRGGDVGQEDTLDDASTSPHGSDTSVVQLPAVDLGGLSHEHESLGVRDDLGSVKSLLEVIDELLLVALELLTGWGSNDLGSPDSLVLDR